MVKHNKKDAQQRQLSNVEINSYKNICYTYSKPKWGLLQWVLILIHGSKANVNSKQIARG